MLDGSHPAMPSSKSSEKTVVRLVPALEAARANESTGRWSYRYRFEAILGRVSFRFRARIRREATYPFDLGTSRQVRVSVRGQ